METKAGVRMKVTTKGWELMTAWKDGTQSWVQLADVKESHPVETAQCASDDKLLDEPAFAWWPRKVLKKKQRLLSKMQSHWLKTHKHGICVPKTTEQALQIDRETGTDHWRRAIEKEIGAAGVSFEVCEDGEVPACWTQGDHLSLDF